MKHDSAADTRARKRVARRYDWIRPLEFFRVFPRMTHVTRISLLTRDQVAKRFPREARFYRSSFPDATLRQRSFFGAEEVLSSLFARRSFIRFFRDVN